MTLWSQWIWCWCCLTRRARLTTVARHWLKPAAMRGWHGAGCLLLQPPWQPLGVATAVHLAGDESSCCCKSPGLRYGWLNPLLHLACVVTTASSEARWLLPRKPWVEHFTRASECYCCLRQMVVAAQRTCFSQASSVLIIYAVYCMLLSKVHRSQVHAFLWVWVD